MPRKRGRKEGKKNDRKCEILAGIFVVVSTQPRDGSKNIHRIIVAIMVMILQRAKHSSMCRRKTSMHICVSDHGDQLDA